jgi:dolichol-phosphate mannosyltransferase
LGIQYSIVVPIYGDGYLAHALCADIDRVMSSYVGTASLRDRLELIFVNDGSLDDSLDALLKSRASYHGK